MLVFCNGDGIDVSGKCNSSCILFLVFSKFLLIKNATNIKKKDINQQISGYIIKSDFPKLSYI